MTTIVERFRARGLHPFPLPLGIRGNCVPCQTCNSYACKLHAKSEADVCCLRPVLHRGNVELWTGACATRLLTNGAGTRVTAVEIQRGDQMLRVEAPLVIVSCGAINSAALLLRSANERHPRGLANSSGLVGRRYMAHLATMISARHWRRKNDIVFQKTVGLNDFYNAGPHAAYPLGHVQSQGRTDALVLKHEAPWYASNLPLSWYEWWASKAVDWLVMTEDLPLPDNRVTLSPDGGIRLQYVPSNARAHARLVNKMRRMLMGFGLVPVKHSLGARNTTHQCGTLVFGTDPRSSVLDPLCRAHDVENLFVVDASFFPSSAAVNPGLTIVAQALRTADHLKETAL
jgi:choline dehydrogenase-like flavoprotein